ncbi:MAG: DUF6421 family protein [Sciscionella sp.]
MRSAERVSQFPGVLFDEAHNEAWSIRPEVVQRMNPAHPADSGYLLAAQELRGRGMRVLANTEDPLTADTLAGHDVVVLAHPSDPTWERTVGTGSPKLTAEELGAIEAFVTAGGGLVVLGECEQDKYGNNINELLGRFGLGVTNVTVQDVTANLHDVAHWVLADAVPGTSAENVLAGVEGSCFYRSATVRAQDEQAVLLRTSARADPAAAPLAAAVNHGAGRVIVFGDSDIFGDDSIAELDHCTLWRNAVTWAAGGGDTGTAVATHSASSELGEWLALKSTITELRDLQSADGSIDLSVHDAELARSLVSATVQHLSELAPAFPHDADYLAALRVDFQRWVDGGFAVPDFLDSLLCFHPETQRVDGREHLVVFPMYTQNGNPNRNFEALIISAFWPDWLAELEASRYDNSMFVPITFVDFTPGYDSHSAVLFPETVAMREVPRFRWGGIFCDREAARFRAVSRAAADTLSLSLPPEAARLLGDQQLAKETFVLWDLIHDRTHSHGDLPFDPFMIKQRMPFWMYSLEELRCDLNAYRAAMALESDGMAYGGYVQYAILFDRLFRFPITGERVRNYDGLGGQLLFAYLRKAGVLSWTDNKLGVDWKRLPEAVLGLCDEVEQLYSDGIDRSKMAHWMAAHELMSSYVAPHPASNWSKGIAALPTDGPPRKMVDEVLDDEFPLNTFYEALRRKLKSTVASTAGATA